MLIYLVFCSKFKFRVFSLILPSVKLFPVTTLPFAYLAASVKLIPETPLTRDQEERCCNPKILSSHGLCSKGNTLQIHSPHFRRIIHPIIVGILSILGLLAGQRPYLSIYIPHPLHNSANIHPIPLPSFSHCSSLPLCFNFLRHVLLAQNVCAAQTAVMIACGVQYIGSLASQLRQSIMKKQYSENLLVY